MCPAKAGGIAGHDSERPPSSLCRGCSRRFDSAIFYPILLQKWKQRGENRKVGEHEKRNLPGHFEFSAERTVILQCVLVLTVPPEEEQNRDPLAQRG